MTIWYNIGTAAATNGGTAVTGSLTAWLAMAKPGDEIYFDADGRGYEVVAVVSNTSLTISPAYAGTTGSGKAYRIKPVGPGWNSVTELSVSVADLLTLIGNQVTNGVGVPNDGIGNDGDSYIRTDVPSLYGKAGGAWSLKASLTGPVGQSGPSYQATSASSVAIGTGSRTFTLAQTGRGYTVGQRLRVSSSADAANYMEGLVASYSGATLVLNVSRVGGTGTFASWNVNITGDVGATNSVAIGSVTASNPGSNAEATMTGTAPSQTLNLILPRGSTGPANSLSIGTVEQGSAAASITGTAPTQTLNLVLPKGDAATVGVGSVTTLDPGDAATVVNSGTTGAAVLDFGIPQGDAGVSVEHLGTYDGGTTYSVNQEVLEAGSTWRYISNTPGSGNAPPALPTTSNDHWQLSARRGVDGTGAVNTVNAQEPDVGGSVVLTASDIDANVTPANYTPAGSSIADHLAGVDGALAAASALGAAPTTTISSASTVDIGAAPSLYITISGTTTITSFGTVANQWRLLRFSGALTLTHNATSLILPGGTNILTAAGDTALLVSDGSGNWRCLQYQRAALGPRKPATVQIFTASGTWTRRLGNKAVRVTAVGGGGGGGGADGAASMASIAGGGASGGFAIKWVDVSEIGSVLVTVGAFGAGGAAGANAGSDGGTSSFGSHCSATGGVGGSSGSAATTAGAVFGGSGGAGSNGDINGGGSAGMPGIRLGGTASVPGVGAGSIMGGGGQWAGNNSGGDATGYGAGGAAGHSNNATDRAGGKGSPGIVIVEEFY